MSEIDKNYELDVLKMVINQYLDESTSFTEPSLNVLENRRDQVVWDVTTRIYSQSGYRVELSLVRDIVNSRISIIRKHLAEEARRAAEEARRSAERKAQQDAERKAEEARRAAEEARRSAERKAQQDAERKAEEARRSAERKAQQDAERKAEEARRAIETNPQILAKIKAEIFVKVRKIISEQLSVDEAEVTLNSHLSSDLGADPLDLIELVMALEEELDIEIGDEDWTNRLDFELDFEYPDMRPSSGLRPGLISPQRQGKIGQKGIVRNVVELIWENAPYFWETTSS